MSKHYFAKDGSFGDAEDILIVSTKNWTDEEWEQIENCSDGERKELATSIKERVIYDKPTRIAFLKRQNAELKTMVEELSQEIERLKANC